MDMQQHFDYLVAFLRKQMPGNGIVEELLGHCLVDEVTYSSFGRSYGENKEQLLSTYTIRESIEHKFRPDLPFVIGYDDLLLALQATPHLEICISGITSDKGSYIIFSDYGLTDFIGILKSKRTTY